MANQLTITLPTTVTAANILATGLYGAGAVIRIQSAATETGSFADISGVGSTPTIAIVSGTETYTGQDPAGSSSRWYRSRIESADASRLSDWSPVEAVSYA